MLLKQVCVVLLSLFVIPSWCTVNDTSVLYLQVIIVFLSDVEDANLTNYANCYFAVRGSMYRSTVPPSCVILPVIVWLLSHIITYESCQRVCGTARNIYFFISTSQGDAVIWKETGISQKFFSFSFAYPVYIDVILFLKQLCRS